MSILTPRIVSLLCVIYLGFCTEIGAQKPSLAGQWIGTIYQEEGKFKSEYKIEFYLHHNSNQISNQIRGRSYVYIEDIYSEMKLEGVITNDTIFTFRETEFIKDKKHQGMEWCVKSGVLTLKRTNTGLELHGTWKGKTSFSVCEPGLIILKKIITRA